MTDQEIDRYLASLLAIWLEPCKKLMAEREDSETGRLVWGGKWDNGNIELCKQLLIAMARARRNCKLRTLTGAAVVAYGLPVLSQ